MSFASNGQQAARPTLAQPRAASSTLLDQVIAATGRFDAEMWTVMDRRDNVLIEQEIMHGSGSNKFVYNFKIQGTVVTGISVVGARHLASHYGGLKHRIVASVQKIGALHTFRSYPQERVPMRVECSLIPELTGEPDYYTAVVEIQDVKSGNTIQMEASEEHIGHGQNGPYVKPHFQKIAQAKAYRNAILSLIPQDVQLKWKTEMLALGKDDVITDSVIDEKRAGVLKFAAKNALPLERASVEGLTMDQIAGLAEAAREGKLTAFAQAAQALGLLAAASDEASDTGAAQEQPKGKRAARGKQDAPPKSDEPPSGHPASDGEAQTDAAETGTDTLRAEAEKVQSEQQTASPQPTGARELFK